MDCPTGVEGKLTDLDPLAKVSRNKQDDGRK